MTAFSSAQLEIAFTLLIQESAEFSAQQASFKNSLYDYEQQTREVLEVDSAAYLAFKLFQRLDTNLISAAAQLVCAWNQKHNGKLVAIPNPIAPTQWFFGICEGINFLESRDSWLTLRMRDNQMVVIDKLGSDYHISLQNLESGSPGRFGFNVFYDGCVIRTVTNFSTADDYHVLARTHRLFCIAAHLLNAADQVPSDDMQNALKLTLAAKREIHELKQSLRITQQVLKIYREDSPLLDPNGAIRDMTKRNIFRIENQIKRYETDYPEIPLLGLGEPEEDTDSDVSPCMVGPDRDEIIAMEDQNPLPDHL